MLCTIFHQAGRWPTISSKWHPRCANKVTIRNVWRNRMCACSIHCIPPTKTVASSSTGHRASSASIECRRAWGRARRKRWASCLLGGENQIVCGEASKRRAASGEHRHQAPGPRPQARSCGGRWMRAMVEASRLIPRQAVQYVIILPGPGAWETKIALRGADLVKLVG